MSFIRTKFLEIRKGILRTISKYCDYFQKPCCGNQFSKLLFYGIIKPVFKHKTLIWHSVTLWRIQISGFWVYYLIISNYERHICDFCNSFFLKFSFMLIPVVLKLFVNGFSGILFNVNDKGDNGYFYLALWTTEEPCNTSEPFPSIIG